MPCQHEILALKNKKLYRQPLDEYEFILYMSTLYNFLHFMYSFSHMVFLIFSVKVPEKKYLTPTPFIPDIPLDKAQPSLYGTGLIFSVLTRSSSS
ncbi:MAG: hypothetical protein D3910_00605 [Candidatus Electrothrix sp. ATG2]|nr:hypothetical protein [Candidatus Electrothrix sp. ATG2]